jgi:hypothetical protein
MKRVLILATCVVLAASTLVGAAEKSEKKDWFDRIKFKGDLRLRYEKFDWEGKFDDGNRDRFRYRLRIGAEAKIRDNVKVGFELRSGNPDNPHSDNQSFDGGFSKKTIAIAQAYAKIKAHDNINITAGKFSPKKLWHVSDMQWDDDVIVEGIMEEFDWKFGDTFKSLEVNLYQFALEESSSGSDAYMFGGQVAPTFKINDTNQVTAGVGYDSVSNPEAVFNLTSSGRLDTEPEGFLTNLVDPATLQPISDFRTANAFVIWKNKASEKWPVKVSLFYYKNTGAEDLDGAVVNWDEDPDVIVATGNAKDNDTAFYGRIQVGDYKKPGQMAFRYSVYDSKPDAIFYAYVQSDTRRGSNVDGSRFDFRIGMPASSYINFTWYNTDWKIGEDTTMDRWQLDYIFKF